MDRGVTRRPLGGRRPMACTRGFRGTSPHILKAKHRVAIALSDTCLWAPSSTCLPLSVLAVRRKHAF